MKRRAFFKRAGLLAAGYVLGSPGRRVWAQDAADARNIELVTVSADRAVITWESEKATEGEVRFGREPDRLEQHSADTRGKSRYHRVELRGLVSGVTYHYSVLADGVAATPGNYSPGWFQTLTPPAGAFLFRFATINDLHVGLTSAGAVTGVGSFQPVECPLTEKTCWEVANRAVVEAINQSGAEFTLVKGDISHQYLAEEFEAAHEILAGLRHPYYLVRGNHDRQGERPEDYFKKVFGLESTHYSFSHRGLRFVVLDSSNLQTGFAEVGEEQFAWLEAELAAGWDERCLLVLHHPVTEEASIIFSLFPEDQQRLFSILEGDRRLEAVLCGHSHRNIVTHQPELGEVPCIETAATVHYPGGYVLYDVYTGGFMQTYHKIDTPDWRVWEEAGRQMYNGDAQDLLLGSLGDRNFVRPFYKALPAPPPAGCGCSSGGVIGPAALAAAGLAAAAIDCRRGA